MSIHLFIICYLLIISNDCSVVQADDVGYECLIHLTSPPVRIPAKRFDQNAVVCDTFQVSLFNTVLCIVFSNIRLLVLLNVEYVFHIYHWVHC